MADGQEIRLFRDGDQWCALRGPDLQEGESGFGDNPVAAVEGLLDKDLVRELRSDYEEIGRIVKPCTVAGVSCEKGCPFADRDGSCLKVSIRGIMRTDGAGRRRR